MRDVGRFFPSTELAEGRVEVHKPTKRNKRQHWGMGPMNVGQPSLSGFVPRLTLFFWSRCKNDFCIVTVQHDTWHGNNLSGSRSYCFVYEIMNDDSCIVNYESCSSKMYSVLLIHCMILNMATICLGQEVVAMSTKSWMMNHEFWIMSHESCSSKMYSVLWSYSMRIWSKCESLKWMFVYWIIIPPLLFESINWACNLLWIR